MSKRIRCWKTKKCGWVGNQDELKPAKGKKVAGVEWVDLVCPKCGAKTAILAVCDVKGLVKPGVMCGHIYARDWTCGFQDYCVCQVFKG